MARILLLGLDQSLAGQLSPILFQEHHQVRAEPLLAGVDPSEILDQAGDELIFVGGENPGCWDLLAAGSRHRPKLPLIVVARIPEISDYLDALEAGATDYCSAPFEPHQVRWILDAALPAASRAAA